MHACIDVNRQIAAVYKPVWNLLCTLNDASLFADIVQCATFIYLQMFTYIHSDRKHLELKKSIRTASNNMISQLLLLIITIFMPPVGVFFIAGCGADLLINICLTVLGYATDSLFPHHISFIISFASQHTNYNTASSLATSMHSTSNTSTSRERNRVPLATTTTPELLASIAITSRLAVEAMARSLLLLAPL